MGPMVHLVTVKTGFEAKLIAARLGADGIVSELRGGVDGPYPIGPVYIYVGATDADLARELLVPVALESDFDLDSDGDAGVDGDAEDADLF